MPPAYHCSTMSLGAPEQTPWLYPSVPREMMPVLDLGAQPPSIDKNGPCEVPDCAVCSGECGRRGT